MLKQQHSAIHQKSLVIKTEAFNFVPGTINTKRGAAVNLQDDTIIWSKSEVAAPPVPPRKHVHFTSTPHPPPCKTLFDVDQEVKTEPLSNTNPFSGHIADINPIPIVCQDNPFLDAQHPKNPGQATTFISNTKKMREPKLPKLWFFCCTKRRYNIWGYSLSQHLSLSLTVKCSNWSKTIWLISKLSSIWLQHQCLLLTVSSKTLSKWGG